MIALPQGIQFRHFLPGSMCAPRPPLTWREHIAAGLILLAKKIVGFDSEEGFRYVADAARAFNMDVGTNRIPRAESPAGIPFEFYIGKTSGAINKGATNGTVTIWDSATDASSIAATSSTLTSVYNPWANVADAKFVLVIQMPFTNLLCAAEC